MTKLTTNGSSIKEEWCLKSPIMCKVTDFICTAAPREQAVDAPEPSQLLNQVFVTINWFVRPLF